MKTIQKTILALTLISLSFISCNKDEDETPVVFPEQNPLAGYLSATGFDQVKTNRINGGDYEFGFSFIPLVNGKMTALIVKIPDVQAGLRITIWDKATAAILRTESIDVTTADVEVTKAITALELVKDKEYFFTFNSNDWYNYKRTDNAAITYPFTVGDLKITSYSYSSGATQAIPTAPQFTYYAGDCSFKFQRTE